MRVRDIEVSCELCNKKFIPNKGYRIYKLDKQPFSTPDKPVTYTKVQKIPGHSDPKRLCYYCFHKYKMVRVLFPLLRFGSSYFLIISDELYLVKSESFNTHWKSSSDFIVISKPDYLIKVTYLDESEEIYASIDNFKRLAEEKVKHDLYNSPWKCIMDQVKSITRIDNIPNDYLPIDIWQFLKNQLSRTHHDMYDYVLSTFKKDWRNSESTS